MAVFFDEVVDQPFYVELGPGYKDTTKFVRGQLFWAPICYTLENKQLWRPVGYDKTTTTAVSQFEVKGWAVDAFKRKLPIQAPLLATNEEFLVVRAKRRPVVLWTFPLGNLGKAGLAKHVTVLPRYGVTKGVSDLPKYAPETIERIRKLEFPDLFFLPAKSPHLEKDGILRLDLQQSIAFSVLEPLPLRLAEPVLHVLVGQFAFHFCQLYGGLYSDAREMLLNP